MNRHEAIAAVARGMDRRGEDVTTNEMLLAIACMLDDRMQELEARLGNLEQSIDMAAVR